MVRLMSDNSDADDTTDSDSRLTQKWQRQSDSL